MSTDQFSNIKNLSVEIGQPTYVELISVQEKTEIAVLGPEPTVESSLNSLAFGSKSRRYIQPTRKQGVISPIRKPGIPQKAQKYSLTKSSTNAENPRAERVSSEFKSLLINPLATIVCGSGPATCDEPTTDCMIDFGVVLDNTGSMGGAINAVKNAVDTIAGYFQTISGGNYRMGLMTFGDCAGTPGIQSRVKFPTGGSCGNVSQFKVELNNVTAKGGGGYAEAGDVALQRAVDGTGLGVWRDDPNVIKVILFITDASVGGCDDKHDPEDTQRLYDAATAAATCGIRIIYAATPATTPDVATAGQQVANITNGLFVQTQSSGTGLAELVYSFVFSLCSSSIEPPECVGGNDVILNGTFDTSIAGWVEEQPTASWNAAKKSLELNGPNCAVTQTVSGLTPGDLATVFLDVSGGTTDSILTYGFAEDNTTYDVPANAEAVRISFNMNVPDDGILSVIFKTTSHTFIDNVRLCVVPVTECGPGTRNNVLNPHFANGVQYWTDGSLTQLTPVDDSAWWDSGNDALIVSLSGAPVVTQVINGLYPGRSMSFGFTLVSHEPSTIGDLEFIYEILDQNGVIVLTDTIKNSNVTFPYSVYKSFTAPSSKITIKFRLGPISGGARVRDVLLCDLTGGCQPGYNKLSFNSFTNDREEWSGGNYIPTGHMLIVYGQRLTRTYTDLQPGSTFQITLEAIDDGGVVIELLSGSAKNQYTSPITPGIYTTSCIVQDDGLVNVSIMTQEKTNGDIIGGTRVDNILVCQSEPADSKCDGSISNLSAGIEWNGIPRRPINIFNMFARITQRDPLDPYNRTITNIIPISDGHVGTEAPTACGTGSTCDFWKQHGNGGTAETAITKTGLNTTNIQPINTGDFWRIDSRENWLWSIPANPSGSLQDSLVSSFPPDQINGIVESVEIFYLANQIIPVNTTTTGILYLANSTAQTIELLYSDGNIQTIMRGVGNIDDLVVDEARNTIFFIQTSQGATENSIWSCSLDGSDGFRVRYVSYPSGIDIDRNNSYIYYAEIDTKAIRRCNYDGTNDELIITSPLDPFCLRIDPTEGYLYWTGVDPWSLNGSVFRCNLNGSGLTTLGNFFSPRSIEVTPTKLYIGVSSTSYLSGCVYRMNHDGSNVELLPIAGFICDDLAIKDNILYITDTGNDVVISTDLDGNNRKVLTSDSQNRRGIALASVSSSNSGISDPVCPGPFACSPDPASEYDVVIKYKNNLGLNKEFRVTAAKNSLYPQEENFLIGEQWDTVSTLGSGLRGSIARWESEIFYLDTTKGTGLDQCTTPVNFVATGTGNLIFSQFDLSGSGSFFDPCDSEVIVTEIAKGSRDNEIQSIVLPSPTGGTWDLTVNIDGTPQTATMPWDADSNIVQIRLERLSSVGHGNISVTGSGTSSNPFIVEFTGDLAGISIPPMTASGSNLSGAASGVVETITSGTKNERQTISVTPGTLDDLIVHFNGAKSIPIIYNWSLNQKQAAFWGMSSIGNSGVLITGGTTDRDSPYTGDLIIDFVGPFAQNNVPQVVVEPTPNYMASTNWQGGVGVNEKQRLQIIADSGTFTIKIYNPDDTTGATYFITAPIPYNANSDQIKASLVASGYVTNSDISVTQPNTSINEWIVEFIGARSGVGIKQMEIDSSQLYGGNINITEVTNGGSTLEKQRIVIKKATAGYFRLSVTINGINRTSGKIPWDTTAAGLQQILEAHPQIDPGDVTVVQNANGPNPDVTARFTVTFKGGFGDVPLMVPDYARTLLCNPIVLPPVPPPPYDYPIPLECDIEDLSCQSGPLLSRPCPGDEPLPDTICCTDLTIRESANISVRLSIQRDLFDPNRKSVSNGISSKMTIRDITRMKGLNPSHFTPYLRNFQTGKLTETTYTKELETGLSIILIEKSLDTASGRSRVLNHFSSHREILPTRMVWPSGIIAVPN